MVKKGGVKMCGCGMGHGHGMEGNNRRMHDHVQDEPSRKDDPSEILKARFAKGEITVDEFRQMRDVLESH